MKRYVIEYHTCIEVKAESKWDAFDKAWQQIEKGDFEFAEPEVVESEHIPEEHVSHARMVPTPTHMMAVPMITSPYERTRAAVYATGNKWAIENFNATH